MDLKFKISGRIAKPVADVFEAVVEPKQLSAYFTTGGARGRLETGVTVMWDFADFPGALPVKVREVVANKRIVLAWPAADGTRAQETGEHPGAEPYDTTIVMEFEALEDGRTLVSISESGWHDTPKGLAASYGNCEGWTGMLCALKLWVERGINLRAGFYK